jgi:predicted glycogen debranching enzyme
MPTLPCDLPSPLRFEAAGGLDHADCLARTLDCEWLETDARGGYASSTVPFCPTRRYHGLLVAWPPGMAKRHVLLSRFEEILWIDGRAWPISVARFGDVLSPRGHEHLVRFERTPFPRSVYRLGPLELAREVQLVRGTGELLCAYTLSGGGDSEELELELRPMLPCREADALTIENEVLDARCERLSGGLRWRPYAALPAVSITIGGGAWSFEEDPIWFKGLEHSVDRRRGYEYREDQWSPGALRIGLRGNQRVVVAAGLDTAVADPEDVWRRARAARLEGVSSSGDPLFDALSRSADDFLYRTPRARAGILAGFPWFHEWGRDTYLSLPGLTLARGRLEACGEILRGALDYLRDGLLPNIFADTVAGSHYGSVDAALWFARAVGLYRRAGADAGELRDVYLPALREIAAAYQAGTALGIRADDSGLLAAGSEQLNATWMDARTADGPVTPRDGCAVEINALWYSLLAQLAQIEPKSRAKARWKRQRDRVGQAFLERFWLAEEGYLADRWKDGRADTSVRPNMVLAAALELSPLSTAQRGGVVERARSELLTPRGLRTLSPRHPDYVGRYQGGPEQRDRAYHQGTAWPWLVGFYAEALLRAEGWSAAAQGEVRRIVSGFEAELSRAGLGHVSEVFDGDEPQRPGGSFAQAWNTAELLRALALLREGASEATA